MNTLQANESDVMAALEKKVVTPHHHVRVKVYTPQRFISALILRDGNKCENELVMTLRAVNIKDTKLNKILEHYCQNGRVQGLRIVSISILPKCIFPAKSAYLAMFFVPQSEYYYTSTRNDNPYE